MRKHLFSFALIFLWCTQAYVRAFSYIDFDTAMSVAVNRTTLLSGATKTTIGRDAVLVYDFFQRLYEKNSFLHVSPACSLKIPKKIHQIWIGSQVPDEFRAFQRTWQLLHPDWEYRLWTQHDIPHMQLYNRDLIERVGNPGELSDLLRYEILYTYGGLYVDMDFECLQPLDQLHYMYDLYVGVQPLDSGMVQLGIGLIGACAGHPLLSLSIKKIAERYVVTDHQDVTGRTGPVFFTQMVMAYIPHASTMDVALPSFYCYPLACEASAIKKYEWRNAGAFGIHYWAKSWLKSEFRKEPFKTIKNY